MVVTRKKVLVVGLVLTSMSLLIAAGCSLVTSYDGFAPAEGKVVGCGKEIPLRPPPSTGGGSKTLVGAISFIRFIDQTDASPLGYDLDGLCTCPQKTACRSKLGPQKPCDLPSGSGIDNAAGSILNILYPPSASAMLTDALKTGRSGLVIRIQNYNGARDDADVSVSLFNVVGVNGKTDGTGAAKFDGFDEMIVDDESLLAVSTTGAKFYDTSAFVADGVLVASLDYSLRLEIPNPQIDASSVAFVPLTTAHLIGKITTVGANGLKMTDAQLVGRIGETEIFNQLSRIGVCQDGGAFAGVKQSTCMALDLPVSKAADGKDMRCDALSLAIGLTVMPAMLGGHAPANDGRGLCGDEPPTTCE